MVDSRNTECPYCTIWAERRALGHTVRFGDVSEWVGVYWTHCTTCHSRDHDACEACGACLDDYDTGVDTPTGYLRTYKNYRRDTRYCSNACRQRAYRQRQRA
jgi:hypothetical protein